MLGRVEGWMCMYKEAQSRMNVLQPYQDFAVWRGVMKDECATALSWVYFSL